MSTFAIDAKDISISFNGIEILHNVNFAIKSGEVHALVGTNGAGKSTLVKIITGVYKKDSGTIRIFGNETNYDSPDTALEAGIAMVFQDLSLIPTMTVSENIFLKSNPYRKGLLIDDRTNAIRSMELLKMIGVENAIRPDDVVADLSVGHQQLVEIAKALSNNPKILILDEPTASLSNAEIEQLFTVINTLKSQGITIIYITHYLQDIFKICDGVTLLRDGNIMFSESTNDISLDFLVNAMTNNQGDTIAWNKKSGLRAGTPALDLQNISTNKIHDVSIKAYPGEIVGIVGLLGSGRTELLKAIFGIDKITQGKMLLQGEEISLSNTRDAINKGITLVPENRREQGLILDYPVSENVIMSIISRIRKLFMVDEQKKSELTKHYIKKLGVKTQGPEQIVRFLSGGNQQKIVVAKCLASDSKILLLDDPTFGVDVQAKHEIMKIIHDYADKGNTVILVSSEFNEIADFCDSIYVMKRGTITDLITTEVNEDTLLYMAQ